MYSIFKQAINFQESAARCDEQRLLPNGDIDWLPIPYIVNAAFSSELFLKSILESKRINSGKNHKLNDLFDLLPQEIQKQIENRCGDVNFQSKLEKVSNIFVEWRYLHEEIAKNASIYADLDFMKKLLQCLYVTAK